jgi:DNA-binding MarR family transcriptional regulator
VQHPVSEHIVPVARAHRALAAALLAELGLYPGQELMLYELAAEGNHNQRELAERLRVEPPTVAKMLGRMQQQGLIERHPDPDDRRVTRVSLSAHGRATLAAARRAWDELEWQTTAQLTPAEQATLCALLAKVRDALYERQRHDFPFEAKRLLS